MTAVECFAGRICRPAVRFVATLAACSATLGVPSTSPHAAGTAYSVEASDVGELGGCKVEGWASIARNGDRLLATSPACTISNMPRMEFSLQYARARAEDAWATSFSPKLKLNLIPTEVGKLGLAVTGGVFYDQTLRETTSVFAYIPASLRINDFFRINANAGWNHDRVLDRHFATYGLGIDWRFMPKLTLTLETFGQFDGDDHGSITQPRYQAGVRYRPVDAFSVDFIYGRNINGENADWLTIGTTYRFGG